MDVAQWLRQLGLERYELAFRENDIGASLLPSLTAEDLKELGVLSVGHRRLLLKAIAEFRESDFDNSGSTVSGDPERRQLTVMFCDLIGSTALSEKLDPEDLRDVIRIYQARVREAISRFGGFIARYVGDGVLVYFGWPAAHETDAERAVRAALAVTSAISDVPLHGETLRARIGIATGLVIVGEPIGSGDSRQQTAIGETPNLAARLQGLAGPGGIVISGHTRRLLGNLFEYRDLGRVEIRGLTDPVSAFEVLRPSAIESRFEALHASQLSPIVGRYDELSVLQECWYQAIAGRGQVVLLSGEAGIGKSRLIAAVRERLRNEPHIQFRHFCSPHHRDSVLHPFTGQIERAARFSPKDSGSDRLTKLESLVHEFTPQLADVVPILAALLSIPTGERYPPLRLSPAQQRRRTFAALLDRLDGLSRGHPVLLFFEDAHWADPTSLELLDLVTERIRHLPILVVISFRTEFEPPWAGLPGVTWLVLRRLDPIHVRAIVGHLIEGRALPADVMEQIIAKTDGVPLFIEELTKAVMESGLLVDGAEGYRLDGPIPPLAIPTTLQDSLIARLDRLAPVKEIAQVGAAIGRDFSYALLRGIV